MRKLNPLAQAQYFKRMLLNYMNFYHEKMTKVSIFEVLVQSGVVQPKVSATQDQHGYREYHGLKAGSQFTHQWFYLSNIEEIINFLISNGEIKLVKQKGVHMLGRGSQPEIEEIINKYINDEIEILPKFFDFEKTTIGTANAAQRIQIQRDEQFDLKYKDIQINSDKLQIKSKNASVHVAEGAQEINGLCLLIVILKEINKSGSQFKTKEGLHKVFNDYLKNNKAKGSNREISKKSFPNIISHARNLLKGMNSDLHIPHGKVELSLK